MIAWPSTKCVYSGLAVLGGPPMLRRNEPGSQRSSPPGVRVSMDVIMLDPEAREGLSDVESISLPRRGDVVSRGDAEGMEAHRVGTMQGDKT